MGAATPGTTLRLAFRDGGVAVVVGGREIGIADLERSSLRGLFFDGEGVLWLPPPLLRQSLWRGCLRRGGARTPAPSGMNLQAGRGAVDRQGSVVVRA